MRGYCHCGEPLHTHYTNRALYDLIEDLIRVKGMEYVPITVGGRTWLVQIHYVALHGIKAEELPTLGFEEIKP